MVDSWSQPRDYFRVIFSTEAAAAAAASAAAMAVLPSVSPNGKVARKMVFVGPEHSEERHLDVRLLRRRVCESVSPKSCTVNIFWLPWTYMQTFEYYGMFG